MHGIFTGESRSGKTVAATRFISELTKVRRKKTGKRLRIVALDPKQDWRILAKFVEPERFHFYSLGNPEFLPISLNLCKVPKNVNPQVWADSIIEIFCRAYGLMERGKAILAETLYALYDEVGVFEDSPNWRDFVPQRSAKVTFPRLYERMNRIKLDLEDPANEPQYNKPGFLELGISPEQAPDTPTYITLDFEKGIPTALNGEKLSPVALIEKLNKLGGDNGIGLVDIVENRLVGMKCRGVYETPGGAILYKAHELLEMLCLDRETSHYKKLVAQKFGELVYFGQWFTPLREAISAFVDKTQETVTGDVKLKLYKGNMINAGVTSPYTLYSEDFATFDADEVYDQKDSAGFINLFGLPIKVKAILEAERNK